MALVVALRAAVLAAWAVAMAGVSVKARCQVVALEVATESVAAMAVDVIAVAMVAVDVPVVAIVIATALVAGTLGSAVQWVPVAVRVPHAAKVALVSAPQDAAGRIKLNAIANRQRYVGATLAVALQ